MTVPVHAISAACGVEVAVRWRRDDRQQPDDRPDLPAEEWLSQFRPVRPDALTSADPDAAARERVRPPAGATGPAEAAGPTEARGSRSSRRWRPDSERGEGPHGGGRWTADDWSDDGWSDARGDSGWPGDNQAGGGWSDRATRGAGAGEGGRSARDRGDAGWPDGTHGRGVGAEGGRSGRERNDASWAQLVARPSAPTSDRLREREYPMRGRPESPADQANRPGRTESTADRGDGPARQPAAYAADGTRSPALDRDEAHGTRSPALDRDEAHGEFPVAGIRHADTEYRADYRRESAEPTADRMRPRHDDHGRDRRPTQDRHGVGEARGYLDGAGGPALDQGGFGLDRTSRYGERSALPQGADLAPRRDDYLTGERPRPLRSAPSQPDLEPMPDAYRDNGRTNALELPRSGHADLWMPRAEPPQEKAVDPPAWAANGYGRAAESGTVSGNSGPLVADDQADDVDTRPLPVILPGATSVPRPQPVEAPRGPFEPARPSQPSARPVSITGSVEPPPSTFAAPPPAAAPNGTPGALSSAAMPSPAPPSPIGSRPMPEAAAAKLDQIKDLYLTAEAIGDDALVKHFEQVSERQRNLIREFFERSRQKDAEG
jgi:hypothetical protein